MGQSVASRVSRKHSLGYFIFKKFIELCMLSSTAIGIHVSAFLHLYLVSTSKLKLVYNPITS